MTGLTGPLESTALSRAALEFRAPGARARMLHGKVDTVGLAANLTLLFCYPGLHLYQYHSSVGHLPRYLDGAYGLMVLALTAGFGCLLAARLIQGAHPLPLMGVVGLFAAFVTVYGLWTAIHHWIGDGPRGGRVPFFYYSRALLDYLFLFSLGFFVVPHRLRWTWMACFALIAINMMLNINPNRLMIDLRGVLNPAHRGAYLGLSTTALVTGLIAWSVARSALVRMGILGVLMAVLFAAGSRANLAAFVLILPVALAFTLSRGWQFTVYTSGAMAGVAVLTGTDLIQALTSSRHAQFLDPSQMTSLVARADSLVTGIAGTLRHPLLGDYAGQLIDQGKFGLYIHNWLSVWQAFGLLPFVAYTLLMLAGVGFALHILWTKGRQADRFDQLLAVLCVTMLVLVVAAKAVGWAQVALVWGMLAGRVAGPAAATIPAAGPRLLRAGTP